MCMCMCMCVIVYYVSFYRGTRKSFLGKKTLNIVCEIMHFNFFDTSSNIYLQVCIYFFFIVK